MLCTHNLVRRFGRGKLRHPRKAQGKWEACLDLDSDSGAGLKAHRTPGVQYDGVPDDAADRPDVHPRPRFRRARVGQIFVLFFHCVPQRLGHSLCSALHDADCTPPLPPAHEYSRARREHGPTPTPPPAAPGHPSALLPQAAPRAAPTTAPTRATVPRPPLVWGVTSPSSDGVRPFQYFPPGRGRGVGTRLRYQVVCLWRRLLASGHCSF